MQREENMGFIRRFLSIGLGLAAGAFAVKLLRDYNNDGHIEGDYVEVPLTEGDDTAPAGEEEPYHAAQKPDRGPNPNPVDLGAAEKPLTEDGKLDATRIACAEDFGDWDDLGCQG